MFVVKTFVLRPKIGIQSCFLHAFPSQRVPFETTLIIILPKSDPYSSWSWTRPSKWPRYRWATPSHITYKSIQYNGEKGEPKYIEGK